MDALGSKLGWAYIVFCVLFIGRLPASSYQHSFISTYAAHVCLSINFGSWGLYSISVILIVIYFHFPTIIWWLIGHVGSEAEDSDRIAEARG